MQSQENEKAQKSHDKVNDDFNKLVISFKSNRREYNNKLQIQEKLTSTFEAMLKQEKTLVMCKTIKQRIIFGEKRSEKY
jgi:hypothetical protein